MSYIEIDFTPRGDDDYNVILSTYSPNCDHKTKVTMAREDLKLLRSMAHNLLIDLNEELNYKD
jgi:hypothetical protein